MGKNSNIETISKNIAMTILHEILVDYTSRSESIPKMKKEYIEYRGQSIKKINKTNLNDNDKRIIRDKVIRKIENRLKTKYGDISISQEIVKQRVDEELDFFFI